MGASTWPTSARCPRPKLSPRLHLPNGLVVETVPTPYPATSRSTSGDCLIAGRRLARATQVNIWVIPTRQAIEES